jgi:hypothetical protein
MTTEATEKLHVYEAKIWQYGSVWKGKLLRDGMMYGFEADYETHDEALEDLRRQAAEVIELENAELRAERIAL